MNLLHIKNLIIDMDGVLWRGETPFPGLVNFFTTLRELNIQFVLATNNAAKTAVMYQSKLAKFGVDIDPHYILTSSEATATYLRAAHEVGTAVYVAGDIGLHQAIAAQGFHIITPDDVFAGATADIVTVGFSRKMVYNDLAAGALLVNKGAKFIGCNPDPSFPSELGFLPGAGSLISVIQVATGVAPFFIGKPGPILFTEAMKRLQANKANTAMVGDRLTTDIAGGKAAGINTILLLSGVTNPEQLATSTIQPDYTLANITKLATQLKTDHSH
ncbi:MAG: HAD-IIA family hydrolase [Chloroflexi bacterium]|nr:HAD-IIA family hydrolase [Chloroflexota bacterium]